MDGLGWADGEPLGGVGWTEDDRGGYAEGGGEVGGARVVAEVMAGGAKDIGEGGERGAEMGGEVGLDLGDRGGGDAFEFGWAEDKCWSERMLGEVVGKLDIELQGPAFGQAAGTGVNDDRAMRVLADDGIGRRGQGEASGGELLAMVVADVAQKGCGRTRLEEEDLGCGGELGRMAGPGVVAGTDGGDKQIAAGPGRDGRDRVCDGVGKPAGVRRFVGGAGGVDDGQVGEKLPEGGMGDEGQMGGWEGQF